MYKEVFYAQLTDDGIVDKNFNEDYTASPLDAFWVCPRDAVILTANLVLGDDSTAPGNAQVTNYISSNSVSSIRMGIKDSNDVLVRDLNYTNSPSFSAGSFAAFAPVRSFFFSSPSGTAANNETHYSAKLNMVRQFGGGVFIPKGHRFVLRLSNSLTMLSIVMCAITGYFTTTENHAYK